MATVTTSSGGFKPGAMLGERFQIIDILSFGSVGTVLQVSDRELERENIALKVLHPHLLLDDVSYRRFRNEVLLSRQLSHPHILRIYDFSKVANHRIVSMELVRGCNLEDLIKSQGALPVAEVLRILISIAKGLAHAHRNRVVHRDLKPSNILLAESGAVKIADFGLAQSLNTGNGLTRTGETLGTPAYMSPEQFLDEEIDARSDIYSFGILAYELITGELPFAADSFYALADQHLLRDLPPLTTPELPPGLAELIKECTQKRPADRIQSSDVLVERLKAIGAEMELDGATKALRALPARASFARRRRTRSLLLLQCICFIAVVTAVLLTMRETRGKRQLASLAFDIQQRFGFGLPPVEFALGISDIDASSPDFVHHITMRAIREVGQDPFAEWVFDRAIKIAHNVNNLYEGTAPLHRVVLSGNVVFIREVLAAGADPNLKDSEGYRPLDLLGRLGFPRPSVTGQLILFGADPGLIDPGGSTPLVRAIERSDRPVIEQLLKAHNRQALWAPDSHGRMPMHVAVELRDAHTVIALLEAGVPVDLRDNRGRTALIALAEGKPTGAEAAIARLLLDAGAQHEARDNYGCTAFAYALQRRSLMIAELEAAGAAAPAPGSCIMPEEEL